MLLRGKNAEIKCWTEGVHLDGNTMGQLIKTASLPIIYKHIAVMPDAHLGRGSTVGSVIPTVKAIIPAAVGVDIGCGMVAVKTSLTADDLPDNLKPLRMELEAAIPHGGPGKKGSWGDTRYSSWEHRPVEISKKSNAFAKTFSDIRKHNQIAEADKNNASTQLGTLGTGNHFVEVCLDEKNNVWIMLHSGSRGIGNRIGTYFINKAHKECERLGISLVDKDLSYLIEGGKHFDDYIESVNWAQNYARLNRNIMMEQALRALRKFIDLPFTYSQEAINCHHNYVTKEKHFGDEIFVTRKGAVNAEFGKLGIIPGSMGTKSYIVRGKGNPDSFNSCSHGAGRVYSRSKAKQSFTVEDHIKATDGVECRKDAGMIDETPAAYKDIDAVMAAQTDLVDIVHTLKQIVCVKG